MSTSDKICNDSASKSNDVGVCEVVGTQNMSTTDDVNKNEVLLDICANCGKGCSSEMNICNRCKMVKYCNATCKKKHRSKHKKKCDRRVAELHDEALFKQPPPHYKDCPICFQRMPTLDSGSKYKSCCGKVICSGCIHAVRIRDGGVGLCPFCRTPIPDSDEDVIQRLNKRMEAGDAEAFSCMGFYYANGIRGLPQDHSKAIELYYKAGELCHAAAYCSIGQSYKFGRGVRIDDKKAKHFYEVAAMQGDAMARNNLGCMEEEAGNLERAKKHWMIALRDGYAISLEAIQKLHSIGGATKEEYTQALRSYQEYFGEIKSSQRDEAAAAHEEYKYY